MQSARRASMEVDSAPQLSQAPPPSTASSQPALSSSTASAIASAAAPPTLLWGQKFEKINNENQQMKNYIENLKNQLETQGRQLTQALSTIQAMQIASPATHPATPCTRKEKRPRTSEEFPALPPVKNPSRMAQNTAFTPAVATSNRFSALQGEEPEEEAIEGLTPTTVNKAAPKGKNSCPPIVLHTRNAAVNWTMISSKLRQEKATFSKAVNARSGINLHCDSEDQHRKLTATLDNLSIPFHTFQLKSEKTLRVVMRGIIQEITTEEIAQDLQDKDYQPLKITRLNGRDNRPAPLVAIEIDKKYKSIFTLVECCGLAVSIESKRIQKGIKQCHKCQEHGHIQPHCHAPFRCMKCAEDHSTHLCPKPKTEAATCANCGGPHTSASISCPRNPNRRHITYSKVTATAQPEEIPPPAPRIVPGNQKNSRALKIIADMFLTLMSSNPSQEQVLKFTTQSLELQKCL